jgi:hypothetical protein
MVLSDVISGLSLGFLSQKTKKYGHPATARLPFRHSGTILAGIQKYAGMTGQIAERLGCGRRPRWMFKTVLVALNHKKGGIGKWQRFS